MIKRIYRIVTFFIICMLILALSEEKKYYSLKKDDVTYVIENIKSVKKDDVEYAGMGGFYMLNDRFYWMRASRPTGEKAMFFTDENREGSYPKKNKASSAVTFGHGNDLAYTKEGNYFYSTALEKNDRAIARFRYNDKTKEITDVTTYRFANGEKRVDAITYFGRDKKDRLEFLVRVQAMPGEPVEFRIGRLEDEKFVTVKRFYVSDNSRYQAHLQGIFYRNNLLYLGTADGLWKSKIQVYNLKRVIAAKETIILDEQDKKYDIKLNGNKLKNRKLNKGWMNLFEIESLYVTKKGYIYMNANIKYGGDKEDRDCILKINVPFN